jgi:hypothetical protein
MALIPIYCSNESCKHLGFVSVETLPRVHLVVYKVCTRRQSAPRKIANLPSTNGESASNAPPRRRSGHNFAERLERALARSKKGGLIEHRGECE